MLPGYKELNNGNCIFEVPRTREENLYSSNATFSMLNFDEKSTVESCVYLHKAITQSQCACDIQFLALVHNAVCHSIAGLLENPAEEKSKLECDLYALLRCLLLVAAAGDKELTIETLDLVTFVTEQKAGYDDFQFVIMKILTEIMDESVGCTCIVEDFIEIAFEKMRSEQGMMKQYYNDFVCCFIENRDSLSSDFFRKVFEIIKYRCEEDSNQLCALDFACRVGLHLVSNREKNENLLSISTEVDEWIHFIVNFSVTQASYCTIAETSCSAVKALMNFWCLYCSTLSSDDLGYINVIGNYVVKCIKSASFECAFEVIRQIICNARVWPNQYVSSIVQALKSKYERDEYCKCKSFIMEVFMLIVIHRNELMGESFGPDYQYFIEIHETLYECCCQMPIDFIIEFSQAFLHFMNVTGVFNTNPEIIEDFVDTCYEIDPTLLPEDAFAQINSILDELKSLISYDDGD